MAIINVYLLNWHYVLFSHLEVVLENTSSNPYTYFRINGWRRRPELIFSYSSEKYLKLINSANSIYSFSIEANPKEIIDGWYQYCYRKVYPELTKNNCADATQWFLKKFANIPDPRAFSAPFSLNYFCLGFFVPSILPIGITLPGRVMDNAKFHIEARKTRSVLARYQTLLFYSLIGVALLVSLSSLVGLVLAASLLSSGLAAITISTCTVAGGLSTYGLFKTMNALAAKTMFCNQNKPFDEKFFPQPKISELN
ncbi:hypothetical protein [Legionella impletisoli]|uniref:Uncharacterized protein n=1 Tax=Legionella impletisoli TaxID=343510 RepID=A0A917JX52_9GAMM|nr:hypothetical protein [Legionella impletisoli]GGI88288.1 hypothetical protein GCM10007966_16290 [Legionella impletisoli]